MTDQRTDLGKATGTEDADNDVRRLLELAGPRVQPPAAVAARVRAATMNAWESLPAPSLTSRLTSRSGFRIALAASVLVALVAGYLTTLPEDFSGRYVAEVVFASGGYSVRGADDAVSPNIIGGSIVQTSAEGRLLIQMNEGATVRMDHKTSATMHAGSEIWLHSGKIYVDSGDGAKPVRVITQYASITELGTQFEVSSQGDRVSVAVREGQITLALGNKNIHASARPGAGEILEIDGMELTSRSQLSTLDDHWAWTQLSRPKFNLDEATFNEYLRWAARETGRTLIFESDLVRQQTATNRKRGLVEAEQVDDVLQTDKVFRRVEGSSYELIIGFRPVR